MRSKTPIGRIVLAYLAACLTLPFVFFIVPGLLAMGSAFVDGPPIPSYSPGNTLGIMLIFAFTAVVSVIALTAVPAAIFIYVAERHRVRAWWVYAFGAALVAMLAHSLVPLVIPKLDAPYSIAGAIFVAAMAVVPGSVYWYISIRRRAVDDAPRDDMREN